jgi:predicted NAD/FAD-binding protein
MVFNLKTYPNLLELFSKLGVKRQESDMSFSVYNLDSQVQYSSNGIKGFFAQRKNFGSYTYLKFLYEITKFFRVGTKELGRVERSRASIKEFCHTQAVWSTPHEEIRDFPVALILPFFYNHGYLGVNTQFQWYTVQGGSDTYVKKIIADSDFDIHLNEAVIDTKEDNNQVLLKTEKNLYQFDYVILACHSYTSLDIFSSLAPYKAELLSKYKYNSNQAIVHTDEKVMPTLKDAWASWNQVVKTDQTGQIRASTHYWLNRLQKPNTNTNYFCSIDPWQEIDEEKIVKKIDYHHPLFTIENFALQKKLPELNKNARVLLAGAYFGYGFHEDGCKAGLGAAEQLLKNYK